VRTLKALEAAMPTLLEDYEIADSEIAKNEVEWWSPGCPKPGRYRMSFEEFLDLPEKPKSEWVDGVATIMAPTNMWHDRPQIRLAGLFDEYLANVQIGIGVGIRNSRSYRVPDITVVDANAIADRDQFYDTAIIVVEVLSKSTRREDILRKSAEYAAAKVGQYWIVEPTLRTITIQQNDSGTWRTIGEISEDNPELTVVVLGYGTIPVRHSQVFGSLR